MVAQKTITLAKKHQYALQAIANHADYREVEVLKKKVRRAIDEYYRQALWVIAENIPDAVTAADELRMRAKLLEAGLYQACRPDAQYTTFDRPMFVDDLETAMPSHTERIFTVLKKAL